LTNEPERISQGSLQPTLRMLSSLNSVLGILRTNYGPVGSASWPRITAGAPKMEMGRVSAYEIKHPCGGTALGRG